MDNRRRHRESPVRDVKTKIKQEKVSPARPPRVRRSSSDSSRGSNSPPPRRRDSRSPVRRKDRSPARRDRSSGRQQERSPRPRRSRSPHRSTDVRIKREQDDHRGSESHRHRERRDDSNDRRMKREGERPRQRERDREQDRHRGRERDTHLQQQQQAERERHNERRRENRLRQEVQSGSGSGSGNEAQEFGGTNDDDSAPGVEKEKPNFELSGALVEDTNTFRGVVIKYNEPPEARIPKRRWRLYPFKNDEPLPVMYIHRQSAYLLGRQRKIADIPIDHPSCSKQHAVFQYRLVEFTRADGTMGRRVKPYIIDLGSGNGTYLNNQRIEPQRYYELKEKDVLKFGFSSREYVLLHEFSDTAEVDEKKEGEEEDDEGLDE
ncbi:smad nuclear-interacting 1 [Labeo rohita]|uniref:Smad nuclear-interacting 1 n=1 Tax=Labeo rohita TaxID=84645 RepID=A0A498LC39_LABRO|nr:smad nuclear-interacting protein 1 [Labeo rohita]RXN04903.1 smad nuclear-interacting 1 [Labeo rohita]RXN31749.1 smad nuclear-interacting 1 [Labeo rohita]